MKMESDEYPYMFCCCCCFYCCLFEIKLDIWDDRWARWLNGWVDGQDDERTEAEGEDKTQRFYFILQQKYIKIN